MTTAAGAPARSTTSAASMTERTGWTGWVAFAGIMMVVAGGLAVFEGIVAIANGNWSVWANTTNLAASMTTWGWAHVVVGSLVVIAGLGVFTGNVVARAVGVILACASLVVNFMFVPAYPVWALTIIAMNVLVVWALIVHGGEMATE